MNLFGKKEQKLEDLQKLKAEIEGQIASLKIDLDAIDRKIAAASPPSPGDELSYEKQVETGVVRIK